VINIRQARPDEFDAIWPMLREVFRAGETYAIDPDITKDAARAYWMTNVAACMVAENGAAIVGTFYIKPNHAGRGDHICNCGYIVSPDARGQGVAKAMCLASQHAAREMGYRAMQFNLVLSSNAVAWRLWETLGFETVGRIPQAFDHPRHGMVDAFVMHKSLT